jgi:hypothetical protein
MLEKPGVREALDKITRPGRPLGNVLGAPGVREALESEIN